MNTCITCSSWRRLNHNLDEKGRAVAKGTGTGCGECRSSPPLPALAAGGGWRSYPVTREQDGCVSGYRALELRQVTENVTPQTVPTPKPEPESITRKAKKILTGQ